MKNISKKYFFIPLIIIGLILGLTWPVYSQTVGVNVSFITIDFRFVPNTPPPKPIIRLKINGSDLTEVPVNQNKTGVSLNWEVYNATSCTATTSNPSESYWRGAPNSIVNPASNPIGTHQPLNTQTVGGPFDYKLTCTNTNSAGLSSSDQYTVKLTVRPLLKPYIQTTGGDVHTNESISIPE